MPDIIEKLKQANLLGRGGGSFPVWRKWEAVKNASSDFKYIIINGSEGEPNVSKDWYILENYAEDLIDGIKVALDFFKGSEAIIYLNHEYYDKIAERLEILIGGNNISIFRKKGGYIAGEETSILNVIEEDIQEPRPKPPYPTEQGLYGKPTLINNIETFYYISKIDKGDYNNTRLATISGDIKNPGVFEVDIGDSIENVLIDTNNYPHFDFFIQCGGGASGIIYTRDELINKPVEGAGAIVVYNKDETDLMKLMESWAKFFNDGNCDKCTPCREGVNRIHEMFKSEEVDYMELHKIFDVLEKTSFCPLGRGVPAPFKSLIQKVIKK